MKLQKKVFFTVVSLISISGYAQDAKMKQGWNFGPLPAVSYNSDQGYQYGALCDIFYFGNGSTFPEYMHKFNVEVSRYTKGSAVYHIFYDSKYLFSKVRTTMDISYLTDKMMDFYGFNGYMSAYNDSYGKSYYKIDRKLMRAIADFQGRISDNMGWAAGIGVYKYTTGAVTLDEYAGEPDLYDKYVSCGLIDQNEAKGGTQVELKLGVVNDTRDQEADPTKGFWSEAILWGSTDYLRFSLVHRGYIPVYKDKLTFAYRAAWQGKLAGEIPFYMLQNLSTLYMRQITNEGLGGFNSVRGVLRNRVVGDGVAWVNLEMRYRFWDFRFLKQNWYLALNPFFDAGRVVQYHERKKFEEAIVDYPDLIESGDKEALHLSAGIGIKAIMNRNFIISAEYGKPFDDRDGKNGINIGLNFIF